MRNFRRNVALIFAISFVYIPTIGRGFVHRYVHFQCSQNQFLPLKEGIKSS